MVVPYTGPDRDFIWHHLEAMAFWYLMGAIVTIAIAISSWIFAIKMRQRIKVDLGRAADSADLASLETWIKVDEVEQEKHPGQHWAPDSEDPLDEDSKRDL